LGEATLALPGRLLAGRAVGATAVPAFLAAVRGAVDAGRRLACAHDADRALAVGSPVAALPVLAFGLARDLAAINAGFFPVLGSVVAPRLRADLAWPTYAFDAVRSSAAPTPDNTRVARTSAVDVRFPTRHVDGAVDAPWRHTLSCGRAHERRVVAIVARQAIYLVETVAKPDTVRRSASRCARV
jgi:hypothetical protein